MDAHRRVTPSAEIPVATGATDRDDHDEISVAKILQPLKTARALSRVVYPTAYASARWHKRVSTTKARLPSFIPL